MKRYFAFPLAVLVFAAAFFLTATAEAQNGEGVLRNPKVQQAIQHDVSPPLRDMASAPRSDAPREKPLRLIPQGSSNGNQPDPVVQSSGGPLVGTTNGLNFAGVGAGDYNFNPDAAPPDTNGAVGATQ
jgi:hypothetical protein